MRSLIVLLAVGLVPLTGSAAPPANAAKAPAAAATKAPAAAPPAAAPAQNAKAPVPLTVTPPPAPPASTAAPVAAPAPAPAGAPPAAGATAAPAPAPAPGTPGTAAPNNNNDHANEDIAKELQGVQQQAEQVLNQVDQLTQKLPGGAQMDATKEKALKLANDDQFLKAMEELWKSEKRNMMLMIQAGFFVLMIILKAWWQSRVGWFKRLLVGFFCILLTVIGVSYVIPLVVLGEPFLVFTGTLWRVLVVGG